MGGFDDLALRQFIAGRVVTRLDKQFFREQGRSYWCVWVEYLSEALPPGERQRLPALTGEPLRLFEALRDWRREAAEQAGIPVFAVATNRQLMAVVEARPRSRAALARLSGFGNKKVARYGDAIIRLVEGAESGRA